MHLVHSFFFSSRRRHTRSLRDWSSDVCSSDLQLGSMLGFPCVLKEPDSSFSAGVVKADNEAELTEMLPGLIQKSELVVAQEFVRSTFDWRVGVLDGKPLYVCRY